ncbi:uncharacterized protein [Aegilops tauschii subsp. strangulata]|uniref:uncharacterized protein n=1 Tax=Aegilops tauschii subsp. strangulata TaxID=200361 RepID=UPI003CC8BB17
MQIEGRGMIMFQCLNGEHLVLSEVYFIPRLCSNIVSLGQLDESAYETHISHGVLQLRDPGGRLLALVQCNHGCLYVLSLSVARPVCLAVHGGEDAWLLHARYGHIGFQALRSLACEDMVHGLPLVDPVDRLCEACLAGKHRRDPFPRQALKRAEDVLGLVHADLCGLITPGMPGGKHYFLLLVNDKLQFMWLCLLTTKDEAEMALRQCQAAAEHTLETYQPPTSASEAPAGAEATHRYCTLENVWDTTEEVKAIYNDSDLYLLVGEEPASFIEAEREQGWRAGMGEEMQSITDNRTWELSELPAGHCPIGLKWVYKLKKDPWGAIVKHKARLVAKGYVQWEGFDFQEVFAPVALMDSVRVLVALATHHGWQVHHMDVKSAFLNGDLLEEVYV